VPEAELYRLFRRSSTCPVAHAVQRRHPARAALELLPARLADDTWRTSTSATPTSRCSRSSRAASAWPTIGCARAAR
jgi:hypothetical protein